MNEKIIFLGKFQPFHLGHFRTILNLAREYDEVVVGVTEIDEKLIMSFERLKEIFNDVFKEVSNVSILGFSGSVSKKTINFPDKFNNYIFCSGNNVVLENLSNQGYKIKFIPRSVGEIFSGTEVREIMKAELDEIKSRQKNKLFEFKIIDFDKIKPLEKIYHSHFKELETQILNDDTIRKPLIVDKDSFIVLDGSHRFAFLKKYGFKKAPVILVDYDKENIFVGSNLIHRFLDDGNKVISKEEVLWRGKTGNLFTPRSTRHFFPFRKEDFPVNLDELQKGKDILDISNLIENVSLNDEIKHEKDYLNEILNEMKILENYIYEQNETKKYLEKKLEVMENESKKNLG